MRPEEVVVGEVYYLCGYSDPHEKVPQILAIRFVGKNCSWNSNVGINEDYFVFSDPAEEGQQEIQNLLSDRGQTDLDGKVIGTETIIPAGSLGDVCDIGGLISFLNRIKDS